MQLRNNKFLSKLLDNSHKYWNSDVPSLSLNQIEWRNENTTSVMGIISKIYFHKMVCLFLLRRDDGTYVLFAPGSKDDESPTYLYDIMDIGEFINRYPIRVITDINGVPADEIYDTLDRIKNEQTKGFIENRLNTKTMIFEMI
jgi:hypothetical protein